MAGKGWNDPANALRMRDLLTRTTKAIVDETIQYRPAVVDAIHPDRLEVHFVEEPGQIFDLKDLPPVRPRAAGQTVIILVRDGTSFSLHEVKGAVVIVGISTPDQFAPTTDPQGVTVTMGSDGTATVTWDALASATAYDVQWDREGTFGVTASLRSSTSTQYLITGLPAGLPFVVRVRGKNVGGIGPWSAATTAAVPAAVGGLALASSNRSITATWTPQPSIVHYELQRAKDALFSVGVVNQVVTSNQLVINNLLEDEVWHFRVRGVSASGTGNWSAAASIAVQTDTPSPDAPVGTPVVVLTARPLEITATWEPIDGADKYELQRSNSSVFTTGPTVVMVEGNQHITAGLNPAQEYWFRLRAINSAGPGPWSATVSKMVPLASEYTDGVAPAGSPPVTVEPSIKMLTAKWPAQANGDRVVYEVHISTATGFVPAAATKLGETTNTFWVTTVLPNGSPVVIGTTYFMRVIAKDKDGAAAPGAQGSGAPIGINLGEAGDVPGGMITGDGTVPAKPAAPALISGIGYIYGSWTRPASNDPIERYEIHISDVDATFVPDANTLSLVTGSLFGFIRKQGPGKLNAPLVYGTTYYVKIIAIDVDGVSVPSDATSGFTVRTSSPDIAAGAVIAEKIYSGAVMADRIQATNIATDAVTSRVIYSGAVMAERIQTANLATNIITAASAIIADAAITTAKIDNLQVTDAKIGSIGANKITTEILYATLTVSGVIRTSANATRVEMNSGGIYAYSGGTTVFELNAVNGNAYFRGNLYAVNGTFTGYISSSAEISGGILTGALIRSKSSGARVSLGEFSYSASEMGTTYNFGPYPAVSYHDAGNVVRHLAYSDGHSLILERTGGAVIYIQPDRVYMAAGRVDFTNYLTAYGLYEMSGGTTYRAYSPINPQSVSWDSVTNKPYLGHDGQNITGSYLNNGRLYIRTNGDTNHMLAYSQFGATDRDGPDLRGYGHIGFIVVTYSSGAYHSRMDSAQLVVRGTSYVSLREGKADITPLGAAGDTKSKLKNLKPIKYKRKDLAHLPHAASTEYLGLVAEEVAVAFPELAGYDADTGELIGVQYQLLAVPLLEQMQTLMTEVEALQQQVAVLSKKPA